ncbi:hypothetical protein B0I35DRAFT_473410 [Stachybotrys elegans]|uniref:Uncharacterized protein n=1 Tax=Stachybotrys elegans TaxID=80388 RepID=A0A8K0T3K7_9HYPO|nr:hypothetical protein B0I35DRAFT_473410 [Stachybotrys elegans]
MAPLLKRESSTFDSVGIWIVVGSAILIVIAAGSLLAHYLLFVRHKQPTDTDPESQRSPSDKPKRKTRGFLTPWRKPAPPPVGAGLDQDEVQRQDLIRKSLASRPSSVSSAETLNDENEQAIDRENRQSYKSEWKSWEAGVALERAVSLEQHPAFAQPVDITDHPALR